MLAAAAYSIPDDRVPLAASRGFRYALLFTLTMTELMPGSLMSRALPVLLRRSGATLAQMGIMSLVMLPWAIKALWAPLVDKLGARSKLGRYRSWLFVTHPLLLLTLVLGAFVDVPALVLTHRAAGIAALLWLSVVAATADTASHGLAVNLLSVSERGMGNGLQSAGMMTGKLVGGGLMLMLVGWIGWQPAMLVLAALVLLPLFGVALYQEPAVDRARAITLREALQLFRRPRIWRWLALAAALLGAGVLTGVPMQALFVDRGIGLAEIGFMKGVVGCGFGAIGGLLGGLAIARLGRKRAFYVLQLVSVVCLAIVGVLVTRANTSRWMLYAAVIFDNLGLPLSMTILYTMIMDRSRSHIASTDFTIQYSLMNVCAALGTSAGGFFAGRLGTPSVFIGACFLMLGLLAIATQVLDRRDFQPMPGLVE